MTEFAHVNGQRIAYETCGTGPPVLMLHGFPQTRAMWDKIRPELEDRFTVVTSDLRGYGESSKLGGIEQNSFRPLAADQIALMRHLGYERFHLVGHDRGARTAHRLALDAPHAVQSLTLMDIAPTHHVLAALDQTVARAYYHWFFLSQPAPFPETLIGYDPDAYFESCLLGWGAATLSDFASDALESYRSAWRDPATIASMCNNYRAAIDVDFALDASDLDRRVTCPALILYGADGVVGRNYDVAAIWADRLSAMQVKAIPGGHFFAEQHPQDTARILRAFLTEGQSGSH
jgi:haloacetate dehalogenase